VQFKMFWFLLSNLFDLRGKKCEVNSFLLKYIFHDENKFLQLEIYCLLLSNVKTS
jgi:hypothetical protein